MSFVTLLLVDDHVFFRRTLQRLLENDDSLRVLGTAGDGQEALELVATLVPDIVIMDIHMPGLDGIAACQSLKRSLPSVKVLLYSAHEDALDHAAAVSAADDCLCKDDVFCELMPRIRELMLRPATTPCLKEC